MNAIRSEVYKYAPLAMSVFDIRFPKLPNFGGFDHQKFHSCMYELGLVFSQPVKIKSLTLSPSHNNAGGSSVQDSMNTKQEYFEYFAYINSERSISFHNTGHSLSWKVTHYESFPKTLDMINNCISAFLDCSNTKNIPIVRIGTRYVNLIAPKNDDDVIDYVHSEWLVPRAKNKNGNASSTHLTKITQLIEESEEKIKTKLDFLFIDPSVGAEIQILPQDLGDTPETSLNLFLSPWFQDAIDKKSPYVMLDVDTFKDQELGMLNQCNITSQLNLLRRSGRESFQHCITEKGKDRWRGEE